jgi:hypothetical protein
MNLKYSLFVFFILVGCNQSHEVPELNLDLDNFESKDVGVEIEKIIQLEKTEESIIGDIFKLIFYKDRYYVLDAFYSKSLLVFDSNGYYINKTKHGRGPGEVVGPWTFSIDSARECIMLWDQATRRMSEFDLNLEFISSYTSEVVINQGFERFSDGTVLVYSQDLDLSNEDDSEVHYYYLKDSLLFKTIKKFLPGDIKLTSYSLRSPISRHGSLTLFIKPFDFNIYLYETMGIQPYLKINFGTYALTEEMIGKNNYSYNELIKNNSKIVAMDYLNLTNRYLCFSYFQNGARQFIIQDIEDSETYYSQNFFEYGLIPYCKILCAIEDTFIGIVEPDDVKNFKNWPSTEYFSFPDPRIGDNPYVMHFVLE